MQLTRRRGLLLTLGLVLLLIFLLITASSCGQTASPEPTTTEEGTTEPTPTTFVETATGIAPTVILGPPGPTPIPVQVGQYITDVQFVAPELPDDMLFLPTVFYARDFFLVTGYSGTVDCAVDAVLSFIDPDSSGSQAFADLVSASSAELRVRHETCIADPSGWAEGVVEQKNLLGFTRTVQLNLEYVKELQEHSAPVQCENLPRFEGNPDDPLVMNLYRMNTTGIPELNGLPLVKVIVGKLELFFEEHRYLYADLVYATGNIEGTPYIGEGGGNEPPESVSAETGSPENLFVNQWALGAKADGGIELVTATGDPVGFVGHGVRVGVFDTSPFQGSEAPSVPSEIDRLMPVSAPALPDYTLVGTSPAATTILEDHGLFVASLINKVAPGSDILLYQVLNDDGLGDLFTLNAALHTFILDKVATNPQAAVMNLSLGSPVSTVSIDSLETLISAAHCHNIVVVTSAGNYPGELQTPAMLDETIAVTASDKERNGSCFNSPVIGNWVSAPGGGDLDSAKCEPVLDQCTEGDCQYALIGMVLDESGQVDYDYWSGTSFAAPLVSGLSALLLEQGGGGLTPDEVYDRIKDCAILSDGIIDVPSTLDGPCPTPTPTPTPTP